MKRWKLPRSDKQTYREAQIDQCALAHIKYLDYVSLLRLTSLLAVKTDRMPLLGRLFLYLLDDAVKEAKVEWEKVLAHSLTLQALGEDDQFTEWTADWIRREVESVWPEPRRIRLPSDLEPSDA